MILLWIKSSMSTKNQFDLFKVLKRRIFFDILGIVITSSIFIGTIIGIFFFDLEKVIVSIYPLILALLTFCVLDLIDNLKYYKKYKDIIVFYASVAFEDNKKYEVNILVDRIKSNSLSIYGINDAHNTIKKLGIRYLS